MGTNVITHRAVHKYKAASIEKICMPYGGAEIEVSQHPPRPGGGYSLSVPRVGEDTFILHNPLEEVASGVGNKPIFLK